MTSFPEASFTARTEDDTFSRATTPYYQFYFRTLICFTAGGTLAVDLQWPNLDPLRVAVVSLMLAYAYGSYAWLRRAHDENVEAIARRFAYADAALVGAFLNLINFSLLPSLFFLAMVQFNAFLQGGTRRWAADNLALAAGVMLSLLIHRPSWVFSDQLHISAASLIGVFTYFCAYGVFINGRARRLEREIAALNGAKNEIKSQSRRIARYLPAPVLSAVNQGRDQALNTERKRLTIVFAEVQGLEDVAEELEASKLAESFNLFINQVHKIADHYGGLVNKVMNSSVMIVFGDHVSQDVKRDATRAAATAITLQRRSKAMQRAWQENGINRPLHLRIGINTGYCTVGTFGTSEHLDYTVLGTHVNLASRLETAAEPGEILISHETWALIDDQMLCQSKGDIMVKGFSHPVPTFTLVGPRQRLAEREDYLEKNTEGFSLRLDLEKLANVDVEPISQFLKTAASQLRHRFIP